MMARSTLRRRLRCWSSGEWRSIAHRGGYRFVTGIRGSAGAQLSSADNPSTGGWPLAIFHWRVRRDDALGHSVWFLGDTEDGQRFNLWQIGTASGVVLALVYCAIWAISEPLLWLPLRFAIGVLVNFLFIVCDLTVLSIAPAGKKGRYVAAMAALMQVGFAAGPALLLFTGTVGAAPFMTAAGSFAICGAVVWLARARMPSPGHGEQPQQMWHACIYAPTILAAIAVTAAFEQGALTLMPVYAAAHGRGAEDAALLLTILIVGSVAMTPIAGWGAWLACGGRLCSGNRGSIHDAADRDRLDLCLHGGVGRDLLCCVLPCFF